MDLFIKHKVQQTENGEILLLYIDPQLTNISKAQLKKSNGKISVSYSVRQYIKEKAPDVRAKTVQILFGSIALATLKRA
jgi:hypothetical protein